MITIKPVGSNKYEMKFTNPGSGTRGYKVTANSVEEMHEALNHHLASGPRSHNHANNEIEHCPLCRLSREEAAKKGKKSKPKKLRVV